MPWREHWEEDEWNDDDRRRRNYRSQQQSYSLDIFGGERQRARSTGGQPQPQINIFNDLSQESVQRAEAAGRPPLSPRRGRYSQRVDDDEIAVQLAELKLALSERSRERSATGRDSRDQSPYYRQDRFELELKAEGRERAGSVARGRVIEEDDAEVKRSRGRSASGSSAAEEESREMGIAGQLLQACVGLYSLLLRHAKGCSRLTKDNQASMRGSFDMLRLWADSFDAAAGGLDRLIEQSKEVRHLVLSLIVSIGNILSQDLLHLLVSSASKIDFMLKTSGYLKIFGKLEGLILTRDKLDDVTLHVNTSASNPSEDTLNDILGDLRFTTECLNDLSSCIDSPFGELDHEPTALVPAHGENVSKLMMARFAAIEADKAAAGKAAWDDHLPKQKEDEMKKKGKEAEERSKYKEKLWHDLAKFGFTESQIDAMIDQKKMKNPPSGQSPKDGLAIGAPMRPVVTKVWRGEILDESLEYWKLVWENDSTDSGYIIIRHYVSEAEVEAIRDHSKRIRRRTVMGIGEPKKDKAEYVWARRRNMPKNGSNQVRTGSDQDKFQLEGRMPTRATKQGSLGSEPEGSKTIRLFDPRIF